MDGWNTSFLWGRPIFRGYVSFTDGRWWFHVFFLCVLTKKDPSAFGPAVPSGSSPREETPAETHGRDSDVKTGTTQVKHIEERVRGDHETNEPVSAEDRQRSNEQPTQMPSGHSTVASKGTIPSGTYVALPESACPNCLGSMIDGMFTQGGQGFCRPMELFDFLVETVRSTEAKVCSNRILEA